MACPLFSHQSNHFQPSLHRSTKRSTFRCPVCSSEGGSTKPNHAGRSCGIRSMWIRTAAVGHVAAEPTPTLATRQSSTRRIASSKIVSAVPGCSAAMGTSTTMATVLSPYRPVPTRPCPTGVCRRRSWLWPPVVLPAQSADWPRAEPDPLLQCQSRPRSKCSTRSRISHF